ncbi:hypothetical protein RYX36_023346 [Vicia faba]
MVDIQGLPMRKKLEESRIKQCKMESNNNYQVGNAKRRIDDLEEQNHIFFDFEDDQYWQTQTSTFYCLEYCLKEVCVYSDFGRNLEMHMLRFLLENAKVLEKMFLYTHQKIRGQEVKQQLSNSQKASPIAKLFIFDL